MTLIPGGGYSLDFRILIAMETKYTHKARDSIGLGIITHHTNSLTFRTDISRFAAASDLILSKWASRA